MRPEDLKASHEPSKPVDLARHYLKDMIYGANDGVITTFAVVSGVAGAALANRIVIILGLANLLADGFSMGASNFLSIRSEEAARAASGDHPREPFPLRRGVRNRRLDRFAHGLIKATAVSIREPHVDDNKTIALSVWVTCGVQPTR